MMKKILQTFVPYDALAKVPLPGIAPMASEDWIIVDEAYGAQMAERERLLSNDRSAVLAVTEGSEAACDELLEAVLSVLDARDDFDVGDDRVVCPDGRCVNLDRTDPLCTVGRLVQQDFCLHEKRGDEHVMTVAVLCFPASWTLAEKIGKPLTHIHVPVPEYDDNIARRVQRLFDGIKVGRPMWRKNAHWYRDPHLFHPKTENAPRHQEVKGDFLRTERQSLLRLPRTQAVVFGIHTFVLAREDVDV
ncbi:MAG: heme-dependent oxidative N-demethylase family protein [Shimia sp.]|uniref:heme-dependent oxidative N-demethylase family protein n=2 Tax=Shimia sp. TaxID=1954381 RepID=UPI0040598556